MSKINNLNPKAWSILNEHEKVSLSLSVGHKKSSWQAGEIMNKSHYKYLEINNRAEHFLKIFSEHFNKYGENLIPTTISGLHPDFVVYFEESIFKRLKRSDISKKYPHSMLFLTLSRDRIITEGFEILKEGKQQAHKDLLYILTEFDRWNNFRILPDNLQEPSAYKRRNKARSRKQLNRLINLPDLTIKLILKRFKYDKAGDKLYVPIVSDIFPDNYKVIPMKKDDVEIKAISSIGYFIFSNKEDADYMGFIVADYLIETSRSCKMGQEFWKKFRDLAESSENWSLINNLIPKRKYLENMEEILSVSKIKHNAKKSLETLKRKKKPHDAKRVKEKVLW